MWGSRDDVVHPFDQIEGLRSVRQQNGFNLAISQGWDVIVIKQRAQAQQGFVRGSRETLPAKFYSVITRALLQRIGS